MNNRYFTALLRVLLGVALLVGAVAGRADEPIKVVYQLSEERLASQTMNNLANHLSAEPGVKIVVVGDPKKFDGPLDKFGKVEKIPLDSIR